MGRSTGMSGLVRRAERLGAVGWGGVAEEWWIDDEWWGEREPGQRRSSEFRTFYGMLYDF